eukprot:TRINITY_DN103262_c0_g1_i1.p1 TRINITY_DN103262_c0_g1~~TRINITY_DN103262_c0_g1_i1.p1  ORF type:complete len:232 (+),score=38.44 TRINITY_DN103262_c0_g1_i1:102-797(+)
MGSACGKRCRAECIRPAEDGSFHVSQRWGLRVVCISDTHSFHRKLEIPDGDILIHAGDFTLYGKEEHARDFNEWLGTLPHRTKLVVVGNHENNAEWHKQAARLLSNAVLLRNSQFAVTGGPSFYGTDFFWPCKGGNPYYEAIPSDVDIIIAHGPAQGCVDGGKGCEALLHAVQRVRPVLVVSGHVHFGHGVVAMKQSSPEGVMQTVLVNAANCGSGKDERQISHPPVVVDI